MRGLSPEAPSSEGQAFPVLAPTAQPDHVVGQLKLFGNRRRDAALAAEDARDGDTVAEELQLR